MRKLISSVFLIAALCAAAPAQTTVILAPIPFFQSFLQNGNVNAFGCVFSYISGTTTPLATYTDSTGNTQNANPVILSAGGSASIWLQSGQSYSLTVKSAGGLNCASGSTVGTVNGVGGGASTLSVTVPFSATPTFSLTAQNELISFTLTGNAVSLPLSVTGISPPSLLTFQVSQNATGGYTFQWPSNVIGACAVFSSATVTTTQTFIWNGSTATAIAPCVYGNGPSIGAYQYVGSIVDSIEINATTGYQVNGSYGSAGQVLQSTGTGSQWASAPVTSVLGTDYSVTASQASLFPSSAFAIAASQSHSLTCQLFYSFTGTNSLTVGFTGPASPTEVTWSFPSAVSSSDLLTSYTTYAGAVTGSGGGSGVLTIAFGLINGTTAGNVALQVSASTTGFTIKGPSFCVWQ